MLQDDKEKPADESAFPALWPTLAGPGKKVAKKAAAVACSTVVLAVLRAIFNFDLGGGSGLPFSLVVRRFWSDSCLDPGGNIFMIFMFALSTARIVHRCRPRPSYWGMSHGLLREGSVYPDIGM